MNKEELPFENPRLNARSIELLKQEMLADFKNKNGQDKEPKEYIVAHIGVGEADKMRGHFIEAGMEKTHAILLVTNEDLEKRGISLDIIKESPKDSLAEMIGKLNEQVKKDIKLSSVSLERYFEEKKRKPAYPKPRNQNFKSNYKGRK